MSEILFEFESVTYLLPHWCICLSGYSRCASRSCHSQRRTSCFSWFTATCWRHQPMTQLRMVLYGVFQCLMSVLLKMVITLVMMIWLCKEADSSWIKASGLLIMVSGCVIVNFVDGCGKCLHPGLARYVSDIYTIFSSLKIWDIFDVFKIGYGIFHIF